MDSNPEQLDLSIVVMADQVNDCGICETISLQDLVKKDIYIYLNKAIIKGKDVTVNEIEKMVVKSFNRYLNIPKYTNFNSEHLSDGSTKLLTNIDFFEYRTKTLEKAFEMFGVEPSISTFKHTNKITDGHKSKTCEAADKRKNKKNNCKISMPNNCAARAVQRKVEYIQKFIDQDTAMESKQRRRKADPKFSPTLTQRNFSFISQQQTYSDDALCAEYPRSKFIYYGK